MGQYINGFYVFAPVTSTDHAGLLWVAAILSLLFSVVTLFTRYHIKRRAFGTDDWLITAATVSLDLTYMCATLAISDYYPTRFSGWRNISPCSWACRVMD